MKTLLAVLMAGGVCLGAAPKSAAPKPVTAGVVLTVSGQVSIVGPQSGARGRAGHRGERVVVGDKVVTGNNGRVALVLADGTRLKLNYNTNITLSGRNSKGRTSPRGVAAIRILLGELWAKVTKSHSTLEFDTPAAVAAVKGTEPLIEVLRDGTMCLQLRQGKVLMTNERPGAAMVRPGQEICLAPHIRIKQSLVQPWSPAGPAWDKTFNQATQAQVTVAYVDQGGASRSLVLDYAQTLTGTASGQPAGWNLTKLTGGGQPSPTPGGPGGWNGRTPKAQPTPTGPQGWNLQTGKTP